MSKKAFKAMNDLGKTDAQVKPVLKHLLILYDKNWELIAEDNYKVLLDAIFDNQKTQEMRRRPTKLKAPLQKLTEERRGPMNLSMKMKMPWMNLYPR